MFSMNSKNDEFDAFRQKLFDEDLESNDLSIIFIMS